MHRPVLLPAARIAGWSLAGLAAWFGWAWTALGIVAIALFAVALGAHAWWRERGRDRRAGLPRPLEAGTAAAWVAGLLAVAVLVGYGSDWLVGGALAAACGLKGVEAVQDDHR